MIGEN